MALQYWSSMSSDFLVFHTSRGISSRPATFQFLIFLSTTLSSSCVNCPMLRSSGLLMIFERSSSVTLGDFPSRFLKCCFHWCIHSTWLAAFCLALVSLFLLLTSFTVSHALLDYPSSTESLILLIWFWMYSVCSFRYALFSSLCAFLSFWALALFGFLLLHNIIYMYVLSLYRHRIKFMDYNKLLLAEQYFYSNGYDFWRDAKFTFITRIWKKMPLII